MHVVHVLTRLLRAGSEENTIETCRWQLAAGQQVSLIHGSDPDPYWTTNLPDGLHRIVLPELVHAVDPFNDLQAMRRLRQLYLTLEPDVIHTHQSKAGILGRLAARSVPGALVVHGIHILPFDGVGPIRRAIYLAAERLAAPRTDVFIGVSQAMLDAYLRAGLAQPDNLHCVRSGMLLAQFHCPDKPDDWRKLLRVSDDCKPPPVAIMMAAFEPRKRHIPFLRALAQEVARLPDMRLLLAGQGPEETAVRLEVDRLGLSDNVVFCGHRPDPEALFALSLVSVLTSQREGLPRVVIQSIAAGVPVLAQELPGLTEIVQDGRNGYILPSDDMQAAASGLVDLLKDHIMQQRLAEGARQTDVSDWALDRLGVRTDQCYRAALSQPYSNAAVKVA